MAGKDESREETAAPGSAAPPVRHRSPSEFRRLRREIAALQAAEAAVHEEAELIRRVARFAAARAREAAERAREEIDRARAERDAHLGSPTGRLAAALGRLAGAVPPGARRYGRRAAQGAWWAMTPGRLPERLRQRHDARVIVPAEEPPSVGTPFPFAERSSASRSDAPGGVSRGSGDEAYARWIAQIEPGGRLATVPQALPRVSFLMVGSGDAGAFAATLASLRHQSSGSWNLLVAGPVEAADDGRIHPVPELAAAERGTALAGLLRQADGDFCCLLEPGDVLAEEALAEVAQALAEASGAAILYSDDDRLAEDGRRTEPLLKPAWSPELLQAFDYFGRLTFLDHEIAVARSDHLPGLGEGAEWALDLFAAEGATAAHRPIRRIPRVLCHRSPASRRDRPPAQSEAAADHRRALRGFWIARGIDDPVVETQPDGTQRSSWTLRDPPLVSVITLSRDAPASIRRCLHGLFEATDYPRLEVIVVDDGSTDPETLAFYAGLAGDPRVRVLSHHAPLSHPAARNRAAAVARGSVLLFLDEGIEVIEPGWLGEMVRLIGIEGVGIVGAKLRSPAGELRQAGIGVGLGRQLYASPFAAGREEEWGVLGSPGHTRNWIAVAGACQMVRRSLFDDLGGFDEAYRTAGGDVALCLRAHRAGWRTAYTPFATLRHHEGETDRRGSAPEDLARMVAELDRAGIAEDPYLHPALSPASAVPALRAPGEPPLRRHLQFVAEDLLTGVPLEEEVLDLFVDAAASGASRRPVERIFWPARRATAIDDLWSAAGWIVDLLRRRPDLRLAFPRALSDGETGAFAAWLAGEGGDRLAIPPGARGFLDAAFRARPADRVRQFYFDQEELRRNFPLGLLPAGRRGLVGWLLRHGEAEGRLRLEQIWWFALATAEDPAAEFVRTYRFTPEWQRMHPAGLTVFGREALAVWVTERCGLREAGWLDPRGWPTGLSPADEIRLAYWAQDGWRDRHPDAFADEASATALLAWLASPAGGYREEVRAWCRERLADGTPARLVGPGATIIGHFCYPSGLRVAVTAMANAMERAGIRVARRDLRTKPADEPRHGDFGGLEAAGVTVLHVQPTPFFETAYERADLAPRHPRPYRIGVWYWELDTIPGDWPAVAATVDELWAATSFGAEALRRAVRVPVHTVFPGVEIGAFTPRRWGDFAPALRPLEERFVFLFSFHLNSVTERKNPIGLIRAFREAFGARDSAHLVLKTMSEPFQAPELEALRAASEGANVTILDEVFSAEKTLSLMEACDAYVSLHRSEGLGLTMAEAMLLGKPVIATRYSGNLDFMDDGNSLLVDAEIVMLRQDYPPYEAGMRWAEPSVPQAAAMMRRLYDDRAFAAALGARAREDARVRLSLEKAGRRMAARLAEIRHGR